MSPQKKLPNGLVNGEGGETFVLEIERQTIGGALIVRDGSKAYTFPKKAADAIRRDLAVLRSGDPKLTAELEGAFWRGFRRALPLIDLLLSITEPPPATEGRANGTEISKGQQQEGQRQGPEHTPL